MAGADPEARSVDELFARVSAAGESRERARSLAREPHDERVLAALLRRAVPVAFLEALASQQPWSGRPRLLARVVLSPRAPAGLSLRLLGSLHWRDLAEVAATMRVAAAVRVRAEGLLTEALPQLRFGDRVTLARVATRPVLASLLCDGERRVVEAGLTNPRLSEEDLASALRRDSASRDLVACAASSWRWSGSYAVRLALVLQPRTPLAIALAQLSSLVPRDLARVAGEAGIAPLVRHAAEGLLESRAGD